MGGAHFVPHPWGAREGWGGEGAPEALENRS